MSGPIVEDGMAGHISQLRCRVVAEPLGTGSPPEQVLLALADRPGLVCLTGSWADETALLTSDPLCVVDGTDAASVLEVQPVLDGAEPQIVGGGWFGALAFDGPSRLAFHDHMLRLRDGQWWFEALWSEGRADEVDAARRRYAEALGETTGRSPYRTGVFAGADRKRHLAAVEGAVGLIRAGEVYEVNVCTALTATFSGSVVGLFANASAHLRPRYGAFVDEGTRTLASLSPELFLRRRGRTVTTKPIKGTLPRIDAYGAARLRASAKDTAENVMIVDLMRNDFGRVCVTGSVRPQSLLEVEPHPGLWHLVSTVSGELIDRCTDTDLLAATFPPGSVTGAPKLSAVDAIGELEDARRGVYTGAIGFASPSWGLELSVAIRTFEFTWDEGRDEEDDSRSGRVVLGVGGGITADSVPMLEWREGLHKARPLLNAVGAAFDLTVATPEVPPTDAQLGGGLLETLLAIDGVPLRLPDHLARLDRSARELYGLTVPPGLAQRIRLAAQGIPGRARVRVIFRPDGAATVSAEPAAARPSATVARTVSGRTGLWRHKWAERGLLAEHESALSECQSAAGLAVPLFVSAAGELLETSRGNIFALRPDGLLVTPPLSDDVLPGVTRRAVLDLCRARRRPVALRSLTVDDLEGCAPFWTSSVSLVVPLVEIDGRSFGRQDDFVADIAQALETAEAVISKGNTAPLRTD